MKKITIIALHLQVGGIEKAIANMANAYYRNSYEVQIYCMYNMGVAYDIDDGIRIEYLMDERPNRQEFKDALKSYNPFKIMKEGYKSFRILRNKKKYLKKTIQGVSDGVLMTTRHEDNLMLSKHGNPQVLKVAQLHHDIQLYPSYVDEFDQGYQNIDKVVVLTKQTKTDMEDLLVTSNAEVVCIPNMIQYPIEEPNYNTKEKLCLAVGRLHPVKGFERLVRMFKDIDEDWSLAIVGSGTDREGLLQEIKDYGLENRVYLFGEATQSELAQYYQRASIYCMTSLSEGQGLVLIEAMSHGDALIAFDVRVGPASIMDNNNIGYLIEDGDEPAYVSKLNALIQDSDTRLAMQKEARILAKDYDEETITQLWLNLVEDNA